MPTESILRVMLYWLIIAGATVNATAMAQEEVTVRRAYAKTECAVQLAALYEDATRVRTQTPDKPTASDSARAEQLTFQITDFRVGDLSDIASTKYSELVTKPSGDEGLFITPMTQNRREEERGVNYTTDMARAQWRTEQIVAEDWSLPMVEAVKMAEANTSSRFNRYASFAVTATFKLRTRRYRALFLFGTNSKGQRFILPIDTVVNINGGALSWFILKPIVPDVFLNTSVKNNPSVRLWFESHRQPNCDSQATDVCCDLDRMQCGWK